jgi:hypothetical protein
MDDTALIIAIVAGIIAHVLVRLLEGDEGRLPGCVRRLIGIIVALFVLGVIWVYGFIYWFFYYLFVGQ